VAIILPARASVPYMRSVEQSVRAIPKISLVEHCYLDGILMCPSASGGSVVVCRWRGRERGSRRVLGRAAIESHRRL
jgi:hypothetical protein